MEAWRSLELALAHRYRISFGRGSNPPAFLRLAPSRSLPVVAVENLARLAIDSHDPRAQDRSVDAHPGEAKATSQRATQRDLSETLRQALGPRPVDMAGNRLKDLSGCRARTGRQARYSLAPPRTPHREDCGLAERSSSVFRSDSSEWRRRGCSRLSCPR